MSFEFNLGTTPVQETVIRVSAYLNTVTQCSDALEQQTLEPGQHERKTSLTLFHARSVPTIDLEIYIARVVKYCPCSNEVFLGLIVYLQQMIDQCSRRRMPFTVDAYSIHRLIITGVTVGSKWFSDVFYTNSRYAKVGGLSVSELNNLELQFLSIIDFDLSIQPEVLQAIGSDLFSGRLPKLTNVPMLDNQAPIKGAFTLLQQQQQQQHQQQQQQQRELEQQQQHSVKHRSDPYLPSQRTTRPMSYPGPNGIYYSQVDEKSADYRNQMRRKEEMKSGAGGCRRENEEGLATDSTLTSTSPGDTAAISTSVLNQSVV